jgi:hypothetical protein
MADPTNSSRTIYGFWVVLAGLASLLAVFFYAATIWSEVKDVTAIVGAVSGTIGTLVGAYFGVQVGAAGKEKAEAARDKAEAQRQDAQAQITRLAAMMAPETAARILNIS